jgi:signal transduction histidine kinase
MSRVSWLSFGRPITERTVLVALVAGFGVVMLLLGAAGVVAVREGRAIRGSVADLVREQVSITRLLHEAQVEEDALALVLQRVTGGAGREEKLEQVHALRAVDRSISLLAREAAGTPQAARWRELSQQTAIFSEGIRRALDLDADAASAEMKEAIQAHGRVVRLVHELITEGTVHLEAVDRQIGEQLQELADESALLLGACGVLAALCAAGTIGYVRHSIHRIEAQSAELNEVSWHMLQTQEETARRFAHELHDELGQSLAAVRANLGRMGEEEPRADCIGLVDEAIANVRELSQLLRPVILDDFGLGAGLRWLAEGFALRTRIEVAYDSTLEGRLHTELETHLFRIAQEALTNIARHSGASRVVMTLRPESGRVILRIEDNGRGLLPGTGPPRQSLGLSGMRARARECGGSLALEDGVLQGLTLMVTVPLRQAADGAH